jgi:hypothetical protein
LVERRKKEEVARRLEFEERKRKEEEARQARAEAERKAKAQREARIRSKYSAKDAERIIRGQIWLGMTKEMMIDSWGQPEEINRSVGSWGVHEQCIYGDTYVYIENVIVTSWQD